METLPRDDRAPDPPRRGLPRGVWWAIALAIVVLAVAGLKATTTDRSAGDPAAVLDPNATEPANPLTDLTKTPSGLIGRPMPDATLERFDGGTASLSDYRGTPMVINLWAASCAPCVAEMPALEQVHQDYGDRIAFVGVDTSEGIDAGRPRATSTGVTYDLLSDPNGTVARSLGAGNLPDTILVKGDGTIVRIHFSGAVDADALRQWIDQDLLS